MRRIIFTAFCLLSGCAAVRGIETYYGNAVSPFLSERVTAPDRKIVTVTNPLPHAITAHVTCASFMSPDYPALAVPAASTLSILMEMEHVADFYCQLEGWSR